MSAKYDHSTLIMAVCGCAILNIIDVSINYLNFI